MTSFSQELQNLGAQAKVHVSTDLSQLLKKAPSFCTPRWKEVAQLLFQLTGQRGLPILGDYDFGVLQNFDISRICRKTQPKDPDLLIARHVSGKHFLLAHNDGSVFIEDEEIPFARSFSVFLERIAVEELPHPAPYRFCIHTADQKEVRKLASRLRVPLNVLASTEYDPFWSDEDWVIDRRRVWVRRFENVSHLLKIAMEEDVEIGLHKGRGEAMLSESFQKIPEKPDYHIARGCAQISLQLMPEGQIVQVLHHGDQATERAEFEAGDLLIERRMPDANLLSENPDIVSYMMARRAHRLRCYQRNEAQLKNLLGEKAWESVIDVERRFGGLISEEDFWFWNLYKMFPLVAPGFIAETAPAHERIVELEDEPVVVIGRASVHDFLCMTKMGRVYVSELFGHNLSAGGDDLESAFLKLALDWKFKKNRPKSGFGIYLEEEDAKHFLKNRIESMPPGSVQKNLETFGHCYYQGNHSGMMFDFRHQKPVFKKESEWHLFAPSLKGLCQLLYGIASPGHPIEIYLDDDTMESEEDIEALDRAGIKIKDF